MALIKLHGVPDDGVAAIPETILFGTAIIPFIPGLDGAKEKELGHGITRVTAPFGGARIEIKVKHYQAGDHTFPGDTDPTHILTGGTIQSVKILGERVQSATHIGIKAGPLISAIDDYHDGNQDPLVSAVMEVGWTIVGRGKADILDWDPAASGISPDLLFFGDDTFKGRGGNDTMSLHGGDDKGLGGGGKDVIHGGDGDDVIKGGGGADQIFGDAGNDRLWGNGGADRFHFAAGHGDDVIHHYDPHKDRIVLDGVGGTSVEKQGHNVLITTGDGGTIELLHVHLGQIDTGDIIGW